jgi:hypothetical protein
VKKTKITKRTQVYSSRHGNLSGRKPKTNPNCGRGYNGAASCRTRLGGVWEGRHGDLRGRRRETTPPSPRLQRTRGQGGQVGFRALQWTRRERADPPLPLRWRGKRQGGHARQRPFDKLRVTTLPVAHVVSLRKLESMCLPSCVRMDSGWNWTPQMGWCLWRRPMISPSGLVSAVISRVSGNVSRLTRSEW